MSFLKKIVAKIRLSLVDNFCCFIRIRSPIRKCIKCAASHGVGIYAFAICAQRKQGRRCFHPHPRASSSICSSMVTPTRLVVTLCCYVLISSYS